MRTVWWNGKIISEVEARISIYDSALMFGDTVFEMTRSFNKRHFKLKEHIERLLMSIKYVRIPWDLSVDELRNACYEISEKNEPEFEDDDEHRLMINVTRGLLPTYRHVAIPKGPNVIISDFPLRWTTEGMGRLFDEGINCVIPSQRMIPAHLLDPKIKNRSRLHYLMANIEVSQYEGDRNWGLMLDPDGFIAEGSGFNFFMVKNGKIITPEPRNVLRGISREYILSYGYICEERNIEPYDVYNADEAFVTGTPFCMLPVTSLNGVRIGDGKVGKYYSLLLKNWSDEVDIDIKGQIQGWDQGKATGTSTYSFK